MTSQGNGQDQVYAVKFSEQTKTVLKQLHRQAAKAEQGQQFLANLRHIIDRLQRDPLGFGEPLYRLPVLKLVVCQAVFSRLVVDYAVHEERPLVFLRSIKLLS